MKGESLLEKGFPIPTDHIHHNQFPRMETCVLKVNVDCHGCRQKVKKILNKIEGVFTVSIEAEQQRVIVKGTADPETMIKRLNRSGKHAELGSSKTQLQDPDPDEEQMHQEKLDKKNIHQNDTSGGEEAQLIDQLNLQGGGESGYDWGYQELADTKNRITRDGTYEYGIDDMMGIHGSNAHFNGFDASAFVGVGGNNNNSNIQRFQEFSVGSPLLMENKFRSEYSQNPYARWLISNAQNTRIHDGYMQFHHQY